MAQNVVPDSIRLHIFARNLKLEEDTVDSPWFKALEIRNCKNLKSLLRNDRSLVRKSSFEGRTVLHVAVIQGCLDLVQYILKLFGDGLDTTTFKARYEVLLTAKDGRCGGVTALGLAQEFLGMEKIIQCLDCGPDSLQAKANAQDDQCLKTIRDIISRVFFTEVKFDFLKASFGEDVDYNFHNIESNLELVFHHAFSKISTKEFSEESVMDFVLNVMGECLKQGEIGVTALKFLFELPNAQGKPPFHVLLASSENVYDRHVYTKVNELIDWLLYNEVTGLESCLQALDSMGRTIFHRNVSMKPDEGAKNYSFDHQKLDVVNLMDLLNVRMKSSQGHGFLNKNTFEKGGANALHLAILHNQPFNLGKLLEYNVDLNAMLHKRIRYAHGNVGKGDWWSPLQLAALFGNPSIVKILLGKIEEIYDVGKWKNKMAKPECYNESVSALHLAAASGNSEVLRLFLYDTHFNPMKAIELKDSIGGRIGYRTALHLAADETIPEYRGRDNDIDSSWIFKTFGPPVSLIEIDSHHMLQSTSMLHNGDTIKTIQRRVFGGKKRCMTMLIESGSDMWLKDGNGDLPEPRWDPLDGDNFWWHDKIRMEVIEAKRNLNAAGNAISVVAALVATASYVGPLQPPLGVILDQHDGATIFQVQNNVAVRVFVVSNSASFFLALVALMLSLLPSLPVSQESLYDAWRHSRGTVSTALFGLLLSVLSILVSFAAASCAGMPNYTSLRQSYAFYPTIIGGFMCLIVIVLCFARVLRLIKPENKTIRSVHKASVRLFDFFQ